VFGTAGLNATTTTLTIVPGLTTTFIVPASSTLYLSSDGGIAPTTATDGATVVVDVVFVIDNQLTANAGFQRVLATNRNITNNGVTTSVGIVYWSMAQNVDLSPGTHTIAVAAALSAQNANPTVPISATAATVSGNNTSVLQGQLTVIIVKQ
jgi:hypothetical protein